MIGGGLDSNNHPFSGDLTPPGLPNPAARRRNPRGPLTLQLYTPPADATGEGMMGQGRIQQLRLGQPSLSVRSSQFFWWRFDGGSLQLVSGNP